MGVAFLITLREGVEIAVIVAILLAYLSQNGRRDMFGAVWVGAGIAVAACMALGLAIKMVAGGLEGPAEAATEALVSLAAAGMITFMIFWMRRHARELRGNLHSRLSNALENSYLAVAAFAAVSVLREGIETALLLLGASDESRAGAGFTFGGIAGLVVATWIGYLLYSGSRRIDLGRFFTVTGALLILFAAGMVGKAMHELVELVELGGPLAGAAWTISAGPLSGGWFSDLLAGLFGWSPQPEWLRVIAYLGYLAPMAVLYFAPARAGSNHVRAAS